MILEQLNSRAQHVNIYGLFTPYSASEGFNSGSKGKVSKKLEDRPYAPDSYIGVPARVCIFDPLQVTVSDSKDSKSSIQKIFSKKMGLKGRGVSDYKNKTVQKGGFE